MGSDILQGLLILCVGVFVCVYVCVLCACSAHGAQKRASDLLAPELQVLGTESHPSGRAARVLYH